MIDNAGIQLTNSKYLDHDPNGYPSMLELENPSSFIINEYNKEQINIIPSIFPKGEDPGVLRKGCARFTIMANVPYDTVRQDLINAFGKFGKVELAMVVCDENCRHPHREWTSTAGYSFIRFSTEAGAAMAIRAAHLGLIEIRGTRVRADWAKKDSYTKKSGRSSSASNTHYQRGAVASKNSRGRHDESTFSDQGEVRNVTHGGKVCEELHTLEELLQVSSANEHTKGESWDATITSILTILADLEKHFPYSDLGNAQNNEFMWHSHENLRETLQ